MIRLTITIPNYNGGINLQKSIESCKYINLATNDFEILIMDNKSTDKSVEIINELKDKFSNIRLLENKKNVGRIQNWNNCIKNAEGKYLIFLSSNDTINKENNIHDLIQILDSDETISLSISSLNKVENNVGILKKKYFDKPTKYPSERLAKCCLKRGFMPFGFIEACIYRTDDIRKSENYFLEKFPFNADEIFGYLQILQRQYILFNNKPQINWVLTSKRFYGKVGLEEELKEYYETIEFIKQKLNFQVNYGFISTYRMINLLKYSIKNYAAKNKKKIFCYIISNMIKNKYFFRIDWLLVKCMFEKVTKKNTDAEDLIFKNLLKKYMTVT